MTALTKDRNTTRKAGTVAVFPVAAGAKIFAGAQVCLTADGFAVPAADTAGLKFAGVSRVYVDNSGGINGAVQVEVWRDGIFDFAATGMGADDVGKPAFVTDDQTVALSSTNAVGCGVISEVDSATKVWIDIAPANRKTAKAQADSAASDVAGLRADFNALLAGLRSARIIGS